LRRLSNSERPVVEFDQTGIIWVGHF
jgi:hypothetical protein